MHELARAGACNLLQIYLFVRWVQVALLFWRYREPSRRPQTLGNWHVACDSCQCSEYPARYGEMAGRAKEPVLKTGEGSNHPWVRIPLSPPHRQAPRTGHFAYQGARPDWEARGCTRLHDKSRATAWGSGRTRVTSPKQGLSRTAMATPTGQRSSLASASRSALLETPWARAVVGASSERASTGLKMRVAFWEGGLSFGWLDLHGTHRRGGHRLRFSQCGRRTRGGGRVGKPPLKCENATPGLCRGAMPDGPLARPDAWVKMTWVRGARTALPIRRDGRAV